MAAMKRYLILCTLAAAAVGRAADPVSPPHIVEVKQPAAGTTATVKSTAPLHHLSVQERLELRRQLQQFNSEYRKRRT
jgi:hypothetical protein